MTMNPQQRTPRFVANGIESLVETHVRHDLAESIGPDLQLGELLGDTDVRDLALGYGSAAGDVELRTAIAARHGVEADDVVVTVGGMHALFLLALTTLGHGEAAVLATPVFPNARATLAAVRAEVRTVAARFDEGYRLDPEAIASTLDARVRLVSLASPQNPSGVALSSDTLDAVLRAVSERSSEAVLLIDETYREAVYGEAGIAPSAVLVDPRIVSCGSLSKCHGAPGLRVGWAITRDPSLREQLVLAKFNTVISLSRVDEWLAGRVLERTDRILDIRRARLAEGLARVERMVERNAGLVEWVRPDAGALCCLRLDPDRFDAPAIAEFHEAANAKGVRVAPGTWFGDEPGVFRLGFGLLAMPELDAGLQGLENALHATCSNSDTDELAAGA